MNAVRPALLDFWIAFFLNESDSQQGAKMTPDQYQQSLDTIYRQG